MVKFSWFQSHKVGFQMNADMVKTHHTIHCKVTAGYMLKTDIITLLETVFRFCVSTYADVSEQGM